MTALSQELSFPLWAPVLLFIAWPVIAFFRGPWRRVRRREADCCAHCGYSLAELPEPWFVGCACNHNFQSVRSVTQSESKRGEGKAVPQLDGAKYEA